MSMNLVKISKITDHESNIRDFSWMEDNKCILIHYCKSFEIVRFCSDGSIINRKYHKKFDEVVHKIVYIPELKRIVVVFSERIIVYRYDYVMNELKEEWTSSNRLNDVKDRIIPKRSNKRDILHLTTIKDVVLIGNRFLLLNVKKRHILVHDLAKCVSDLFITQSISDFVPSLLLRIGEHDHTNLLFYTWMMSELMNPSCELRIYQIFEGKEESNLINLELKQDRILRVDSTNKDSFFTSLNRNIISISNDEMVLWKHSNGVEGEEKKWKKDRQIEHNIPQFSTIFSQSKDEVVVTVSILNVYEPEKIESCVGKLDLPINPNFINSNFCVLFNSRTCEGKIIGRIKRTVSKRGYPIHFFSEDKTKNRNNLVMFLSLPIDDLTSLKGRSKKNLIQKGPALNYLKEHQFQYTIYDYCEDKWLSKEEKIVVSRTTDCPPMLDFWVGEDEERYFVIADTLFKVE